MNELQELINLAEKICKNLEQMANEEKKFGFEMCSVLDQMSYDTGTIRNQMMFVDNFIKGGEND
jgi:hypothetical protein